MKILENYFILPIIGAIFGVILGAIAPVIWKKLSKIRQKSLDKKTPEINISGDWTSIFLEETSIYNESIKIVQVGRDISATIQLGNRSYVLSGKMKNQIMIGTYESKNKRKDERGSIVLRLINENLLSGYCTFVYKNKQVYSSPYILVSTSLHKPDKGTYPFCNSCVGKFDCCCNCDSIDMPILLPFEVQKISIATKKNEAEFAKKLSSNLYQMKRTDDSEDKGCIFFQNNKCSIYEHRPIDCRLFPFDFKEINGEYWVVYYNKICNAIPRDEDEIKLCGHCLRPLLELISPYLSECSNPVFSTRLSTQPYKKLFPISKVKDDKIDI